MADLEDLNYKSIVDMDTDDAIELLRQIRLGRRIPSKPTKQATVRQSRKSVPAVSSDQAAELLKILSGGN